MKTKQTGRWMIYGVSKVLVLGVLLQGGSALWAADPAPPMPSLPVPSDLVTINVDNGPIAQVLNAFSRQTGRSIVIGSEVTGNVTLRLTDKPWQEALDVIIKPYGFDYYMVGDTIIICGKDKALKQSMGTNVVGAATPGGASALIAEPLIVKMFALKYLDASDVEELVRSQISPAGRIGKLIARSQSWQDQQIFQGNLNTTSSESLGRLKRLQEDSAQVRGKTLVVVDTQKIIDRIQSIITQVDVAPSQVVIEARFVEIRADFMRDVGVEWGTGVNGATAPGVKTIGTSGAGSVFAAGAQQISGTVQPAGYQSGSGLSGTRPFDGGLSLAFQKLTDMQLEVLLHLMEEDSTYNMLSSPRVLTMNNQDAVIIVGQKLPIIKSDSSGGVGTTTISTSLERYEDIGIKLKVMPQVCEDNFINLIVHPSVRELLGYQSGKVGSASGDSAGVSLTEYPVIATREAETHVMIRSGQTVVIGGMLRDKKTTTAIRVPFLGSIPLLGLLFRRDMVVTEKFELLIFLTARVVDPNEKLSVKLPEVSHLIPEEKVATDVKR
jgi:type IV pilus assembly protein PilQ